jgi:LysM repeat protein
MNQLVKIISLIAVVFLSFITAEVMAQQRATYEVKQGDTLYGISKALNVTIAELQEWNDLAGNEIELGQELVYYIADQDKLQAGDNGDSSASLVSQNPGTKNEFYIVKSGDSLYKIARDHDMTVDGLRSLNNLTDNVLRIGQRITVKKTDNTPPSVSEFSKDSSPQGVFSMYQIKQGESKRQILNRFKMTEAEFRSLNPDIDNDQLSSGQQITVLIPPSRNYDNPYLQSANLENLGEVRVSRYDDISTGKTTTNGELYDPNLLTGAHSNISMGRVIFVENPANGAGVYIRINDRITASNLKLSHKAYEVLNLSASNQPAVSIYTEVND